jgi:hypothetical protein
MTMNHLLLVDAVVNLLLGVFLLFFPENLVRALGLPMSEQAFYPSILGAVLFGIGIALLVQRKTDGGLGLLGAVAINLCGGLVLALWLVFGSLSLPMHGSVVLWFLVVVLVAVSGVEFANYAKRRDA